MTIGDKIRKVREIKGLKQENIATALGMSITAYGNLERGETAVTVERLEEIAKILEVDAMDIMGLSDSTIFQHFTQAAGVVGNNYGHVVSSEVEAYKTLTEELKAQIAHLQAQVDKLTDALVGKL
jgi:transcriptional regulator with XRE-family HTH domain